MTRSNAKYRLVRGRSHVYDLGSASEPMPKWLTDMQRTLAKRIESARQSSVHCRRNGESEA